MASEGLDNLLRLNWPPRTDGGPPGPSDRQALFLQASQLEQLYGGSKRGGKTVAGCAKAVYLSFLFPGNRGFMLRNTLSDLKVSTLTTFFKICPPDLIYNHNKSDHVIQLRTRNPNVLSEVIYFGMGEESVTTERAKEKAKSKDCGWFWIDEPTEVNFEAFKMMLAQLCWYLPDGSRPPYMALMTSNPEPGWVKDRYVDGESSDYIMNRTEEAVFIPSLPRDNPGLPPGWEKHQREVNDQDWVDRYLDGSWAIHEGMVFTELREDLHNLDNWVGSDPEAWKAWHMKLRKVSSLDHADTGITAYVITGTDRLENLFGLAEYYKKDDLIVNHATAIHGLEERYGPMEYRLIDPSCESDRLQNKDEIISIQTAYSRLGLPCISAHRAKISVGLDLLKTRLRPRIDSIHPHPFIEGRRGAPSLYISKSRCPMLWREMSNLKKKEKPDGSIVYIGSDHAVDDLRYIAMSRPKAAAKERLDITTLPTVDQLAARFQQSFSKTFGRERETGRWF